MAKNEARRQKQLAKKKAKREQKRADRAREESADPTVRLASAGGWPIIEAVMPDELWDEGIGNVVLARRAPDGRIAVGVFLVDVDCMGVKDAFWRITSEEEYAELLDDLRRLAPLKKVDPAYLAKLIQEAAVYAQSFGIPPHAGYRHARLLLQGIDPAQCSETFTFGDDGTPHYIPGPLETPSEIRATIHRMREVGGRFTLPDELLEEHPELEAEEDADGRSWRDGG